MSAKDHDPAIIEMLKALQEGQNDIKAKIDDNSKRLDNLDQHVSNEIAQMKLRLNDLEKPAFDPERTIILAGQQPHPFKSDREVVEETIGKLGIKSDIINVKRLQGYNNKPGLVKCELPSLEIKKNVLTAKRQLQTIAPYVYMRSSKSHVERLLEQNARTLLKLLAEKQDPNNYRVTANGKIIERDTENDGYNHGNLENENKQWPRLGSENETENRQKTQEHNAYRGERQYHRGGRGAWRGGRGGRQPFNHNPNNRVEKRERSHSDITPPRNGPPQPGPSNSSPRSPEHEKLEGLAELMKEDQFVSNLTVIKINENRNGEIDRGPQTQVTTNP